MYIKNSWSRFEPRDFACKAGPRFTLFKEVNNLDKLVERKFENFVPFQNGGDKRKPRKHSQGPHVVLLISWLEIPYLSFSKTK